MGEGRSMCPEDFSTVLCAGSQRHKEAGSALVTFVVMAGKHLFQQFRLCSIKGFSRALLATQRSFLQRDGRVGNQELSLGGEWFVFVFSEQDELFSTIIFNSDLELRMGGFHVWKKRRRSMPCKTMSGTEQPSCDLQCALCCFDCDCHAQTGDSPF